MKLIDTSIVQTPCIRGMTFPVNNTFKITVRARATRDTKSMMCNGAQTQNGKLGTIHDHHFYGTMSWDLASKTMIMITANRPAAPVMKFTKLA